MPRKSMAVVLCDLSNTGMAMVCLLHKQEQIKLLDLHCRLLNICKIYIQHDEMLIW